MLSYAERLFIEGVAVLPTNPLVLNDLRDRFDATIQAFPEYKSPPSLAEVTAEGKRYCLGGTSFVGCPSAFHAPFFREMRETLMYITIVSLWREYVTIIPEGRGYYLEQIIDRIMIRPPNAVATKESWHRDECPLSDAKNGDQTFGGWINFDTTSQYFSCVLGSHKNLNPALRNIKKGFHTVDRKDIPKYEATKSLVEIPPGHIIVFMEDIVHEVLSNAKSKKKCTSIRQFFGWRLTKQIGVSIHGERLELMLRNQTVVPIKSGQLSAIYPKTCDMYPLQGERRDRFINEMLLRPDIIDAKTRSLKGLAEMGAPIYPEYARREIDLLISNDNFGLTNPLTGKIENIKLHVPRV